MRTPPKRLVIYAAILSAAVLGGGAFLLVARRHATVGLEAPDRDWSGVEPQIVSKIRQAREASWQIPMP